MNKNAPPTLQDTATSLILYKTGTTILHSTFQPRSPTSLHLPYQLHHASLSPERIRQADCHLSTAPPHPLSGGETTTETSQRHRGSRRGHCRPSTKSPMADGSSTTAPSRPEAQDVANTGYPITSPEATLRQPNLQESQPEMDNGSGKTSRGFYTIPRGTGFKRIPRG